MSVELFTSHFEVFFVLILTILYFLVASYEDFKKKEVYNYINYSYAFLILAFGLFMSLYYQNYILFVKVIVGVLVGFFLGSVLLSLGMWGGGDAKFMMGFGGSFAILSQSLHSFIVPTFQFAVLKAELFSYMYPFIQGVSLALILISVIGVFLLLALLFTRKDNTRLFKDGLLLIALLLLQIFALYDQLYFELRLLCGLMFILGLFLIPDDAFLNLGAFKKKTLSALETDLQKGKVWHLTKDVVHKKETLLTLEECISGISEHHITTLKRNFSSGHTFEVVRPFSIGLIMTLNMFIMLLSFTYSSFFMVFDIFVHMIEFLLLSFTIGGIFVIFLMLGYGIVYFKTISKELSSIQKNILYILFGLFIIYEFIVILFLDIFFIVNHVFSFILIGIMFFILVKYIEKKLFILQLSPSKLVPGDWIVQDIVVKDRILFKKEDFTLGVNEDQIKVLKKYSSQLSKLSVKTGIAFVPHLFLGFLAMILLQFI